MIIVTEHAFTLDQLVALLHGDLDMSTVAVVTHEISEEQAALEAYIADGGDLSTIEALDEDDEDDEADED